MKASKKGFFKHIKKHVHCMPPIVLMRFFSMMIVKIRRRGGGGRRLDRALATRRQVDIVEKVKEESEIASVHDERDLDVRVAYVARSAGLLDQIAVIVDYYADDHLRELRERDDEADPLGYAKDVHGATGVVRVHHGVHGRVHHEEPAARGGLVLHRVPAVDEHGTMMVPVQEDELLLAQHDEHGVDEFGHLAHHEHPHPAAGDAARKVKIAYRVLVAVLSQRVYKFGKNANSAKKGEYGQTDVPDDEKLS